MENNTHKISFKIAEHPVRVDIYIDGDVLRSAACFYPLDEYGKRMSEEEMKNLKPEMVIDKAELEVRNIRDIALAMNEETFNRFCELWRDFHNAE